MSGVDIETGVANPGEQGPSSSTAQDPEEVVREGDPTSNEVFVDKESSDDVETQKVTYMQQCKNNLAQNLTRITQESQGEVNGSQLPWNIDRESIQIFSEVAYDTIRTDEDIIAIHANAEDFLRGSQALRDIIPPNPTESMSKADIAFLEERARTVAEMEQIALTKLMFLQMGNEVNSRLGLEKIDPEKFMFIDYNMETKWPKPEKRWEYLMDQAKKYREITDKKGDRTSSNFPHFDYREVSRYGTIEEGITYDIASFANKLPTELSQEDVPVIFAYLRNALTEGLRIDEQDHLVQGVELALEHALSSNNSDQEVKGFNELVSKMRQIEDDRRPTLYDITGNYMSMARDTGDYPLSFKVIKPAYM
jgi:hypothetical protein